jgi:hypothetical protein
LTLALRSSAGDAVVEALDDAVLPGHGLLQVELRLGRGQAEGRLAGGGVGRLLELLGDMDHRLGRDAADIQAGAAELGALDDDGVDAELAGADGADIAAGSGADDEQLAGDFCHGISAQESFSAPRHPGRSEAEIRDPCLTSLFGKCSGMDPGLSLRSPDRRGGSSPLHLRYPRAPASRAVP